jgi:polar amino acid transport system ATP-binding protein
VARLERVAVSRPTTDMTVAAPRVGERTQTIVRAADVHKHYGSLHVLKGVSLEVAAGEVVCVIGPSGSGKTTFLRCINHLETVDSGRIEVCGELIGYRERDGRLEEDSEVSSARQRSRIGMVFQRFNLFPHMTVLENVTLGPRKALGLP